MPSTNHQGHTSLLGQHVQHPLHEFTEPLFSYSENSRPHSFIHAEPCRWEPVQKSTDIKGTLLQALCTEASLHALRRQYPQIYDTNDKLLVDPATVRVSRTDFLSAFKAITPSSHRSAVAHARSADHMHHPCDATCTPMWSGVTHPDAPLADCLFCLGSFDERVLS